MRAVSASEPIMIRTVTFAVLSSLILSWVALSSAFSPTAIHCNARKSCYKRSNHVSSSIPSDVTTATSSTTSPTMEDLKNDLYVACNKESSSSSSVDEIRTIVRDLEEKAELVGEGQSSSFSGYIAGKWKLIYSLDDITRSSPFFWAFSQAFPDDADQIYSITDSIPAPIKEVGPAEQWIEMKSGGGGTATGKLISRVKVATLNGMATSIMTTRSEIIGSVGVDGLKVQIETTKLEDSTVLERLGPLGSLLNDNLPPFPSGEALEKIQPCSSTVVMRTTFCDDELRVSRNDAKYEDVYVWKRIAFAGIESL